MVELFCDSFAAPPGDIVLDIDDTEDSVYGGQQLALFNAHYDSRCFQPIHIYEALSGKPVAVILRPGKTPGGVEVRTVLSHVVRRIRARWPRVEILIRGDSHYGRPEAMAWCEQNRVGYIFGLAGNKPLLAQVTGLAEDAAMARLEAENGAKVRRHAELRYAAKSWRCPLCWVVARVEASAQGVDCRFVVTNLTGSPRWLYEVVYCARGQAENLIKAHKRHLASDRTSCTKASANQFRLIIHTAAYCVPHSLRDLVPKTSPWRNVQFDTLRLSSIEIERTVHPLGMPSSVAPAAHDQCAYVHKLPAGRDLVAAITAIGHCPSGGLARGGRVGDLRASGGRRRLRPSLGLPARVASPRCDMAHRSRQAFDLVRRRGAFGVDDIEWLVPAGPWLGSHDCSGHIAARDDIANLEGRRGRLRVAAWLPHGHSRAQDCHQTKPCLCAFNLELSSSGLSGRIGRSTKARIEPARGLLLLWRDSAEAALPRTPGGSAVRRTVRVDRR